MLPPSAAPETAMPIVVFTDLDDTLFQTARKVPGALLARSVRAAQAVNGHHSYQTPAQIALFGWLNAAEIVPVTARGSEAFGRVGLPFRGPAIVANGAVILDADGTADTEWQAVIVDALAAHRIALNALPALAQAEAARLGMGIRTWLVEEAGCGGVYHVVKVEPGTPETALHDLAPALYAAVNTGTDTWVRHINGNNLALIPPCLSKAAATAFLLRRMRKAREVFAVGFGDSSSDLDFMRLCDVWMTPTGSQLDRLFSRNPE